jgi:hypothetical protein
MFNDEDALREMPSSMLSWLSIDNQKVKTFGKML